MTDNPYSEASKYETARRREEKRHWAAIDRENANHEARMLELRQALSPAAARIVVAAEMQEHVPPEVFHTAPNSGFVGKGIVEQLEPAGTCIIGPASVTIGAKEIAPGVEVPATDDRYDAMDPNPAPAWLNEQPAPLPAGALLEVPEKPARRRA